MADAKRLDLLHDVQALSQSVVAQIEAQKTSLAKLTLDLHEKLANITEYINGKIDEATIKNTGQLQSKDSLANKSQTPLHKVPLHTIALGVALLGAGAWFYSQLT